DLPWLTGPMQPRIFGPYEAIRRDYPVEEFRDDLAGTEVAQAVYVQANWAPERAEDEARWVAGAAARTGWPHAIVAYADMTVADARPALDRLARIPLVRGIRQQFHWHENAAYRFAARPDLAADPAVRRNIGHLAAYGWVFELQVFAGQMEDAAGLAAACPDVPFVLQHAGMPEDLSPEGWAAWRTGLARLAAEPNMLCKISGFGTFVHRLDPALVARISAVALGLFGAERCLWGSNFPIEKLWTGYGTLLGAHLDAAADLSESARAALFHDTAARVYRL
ncbi:MAG: amidohydrolase family protein, partial [Pseudomonadota bacterium]